MPDKRSKTPLVLKPRFRVLCGGKIALGPGRVELLELIGETGSLRSAAARMGMSYMRAWKIVKSLNSWFRPALVEVARGGKRGGGAELTRAGQEVVTLYRRMERESQLSVRRSWRKLKLSLKT